MTTENWKLGAVPSHASVLVDTPYAVCGQTKSYSHFSGAPATTTYFGTRPAAHVLLCHGEGLHDNVVLMQQNHRYDSPDGKPVIKTCGGYRESTGSPNGTLEDEFVCVQRHAFHKLGISIHNHVGDVPVPRHEFLPIGVVKVPVTGFIITNWEIVGEPSNDFDRLEMTLDEAAKMAQDGTIYDECSRSLIMWAWMRAKEAETRALHELIVESALVGGLPEMLDPEAIIVFPGRGEDWRVNEAVYRFLSSPIKYLLVAGDNPTQTGARIFRSSTDLIPDMAGHIHHQGVFLQGVAQNTPDQVAWTVSKLQELNIKKAIFVVSPYHLLRAYCTLVRELGKQGVPTLVAPANTHILPDRHIPHPNGTEDTAWDAGRDEIPRLLAYRHKGDIASHSGLMVYTDNLSRLEY